VGIHGCMRNPKGKLILHPTPSKMNPYLKSKNLKYKLSSYFIPKYKNVE